MPRLLKELQIREVSSVDRGAGEGVKILLMKRHGGNDDPVAKANAAFETAVNKIMADKTIVDKAAALTELNKELNDHLAEIAAKQESTMPAKTEAEIQKAIEDGVAAKTKQLEGELAFAKMSDVHKGYATECKLEGDNLAKFVGQTAEQRDAFMKEFPPKKKKPGEKEEDCEKSEVQKALEARDTQIADMKKRLDAADEKEKIADFAKRATALGLAESDGEIMRKAYGGDAEAQKKLDEKIKALSAQVAKGSLFSERGVGPAAGGGATAYDQLMEKAKALAETVNKSGNGATMSEHQAFAKVYSDPANRELVAQHKNEEAAARARAA